MIEEKLKELGKEILTQDNRITDAPLFIVQQKKVDWGYDHSYSEDYKWINSMEDYIEAEDDKAEELDSLEDRLESTGDWEKVHYCERWEFVTACFTEKGCKDYLAINGHNLSETRIYADSSYRNNEYRMVRDFLISLGNPPPF